MEYVHYGSNKFDARKLIDGVVENRFRRTDKPWGLWASPVNAKYGWKDWCEDEDYNTDDLYLSFRFRVKANARILHIHSLSDAKKYLLVKERFYSITDYMLDLKRIYAHYDGMELHLSDDWSMRDNNVFYTWDADSICVWNPDVIESEEQK